jgi:flagellar hook assembly protein FlgD
VPVRLYIYDVGGRLVRRLIDEHLVGGAHQAVWDGGNDNGEPVASGIYFYRLQAGDQSTERKLQFMR